MVEEHGAFDKWYCNNCKNRYERNVKKVILVKCPKCKSRKISFTGQVAR